MENLIENTILICEYLKWEKVSENSYMIPNLFPINTKENTGETETTLVNMEFHSNWNWLVYVYSKIMETEPIEDDNDNKEFCQDTFEIYVYSNRPDLAFNVINGYLTWLKNKK